MTLTDILTGHETVGTQLRLAGEDQDSPQANDASVPKSTTPAGNQTSHGHVHFDAHVRDAVAASTGRPAIVASVPISASLADPFLALAADVLDDLETVRIANENRLRQLTRAATDSDGIDRGFGLDETHPDVARLAALVGMLTQAEHQAQLNLKRMMRHHPLGPWVASITGVGEQQAARLLAAIGDPYWNDLHNRPRTVSELWAFCGYHVLHPGQTSRDTQPRSAGVAPRRQRGQHANWSGTARKRTWLIAAKTIMFRDSPYRDIYDQARTKYTDAIHQTECIRCGPSGHPAQPGTPLNNGHQHARALRAVAKTILKDLWRAAKAIHYLTDTIPATPPNPGAPQ